MATSRADHINCLDGLRGVAAIWVVLGHAMILSGWRLPIVSRPDLAVDLFILLSGFLMQFHYRLREAREPWESPATWGQFWVRRFFRIAPLYYLMLAIALLVGPAVGAARADLAVMIPDTATPPERYFDNSIGNAVAHILFVFGQIPQYSFRTPLPDWSIGLEMAFYAVFPFIMLLSKYITLPLAAILLAMMSVVFLKLNPVLSGGFQEPSFLPFKLHVFLAGMLIAEARNHSLRTTALLVGLAIVISLAPIRFDMLALAVRGLMTAGFAALVHGRKAPWLAVATTKADEFLGLKPFRMLGDLSYGAYLIHLLVLIPIMAAVAGAGIPGLPRFAIATGLTLVITYGLAWVGFRMVELPGVEMGRRILSGRAVVRTQS